MAKKRKITVQPKDLPKIKFEDLLYEDGSIRLNPFPLNNGTYRVVGTKLENEKWFHCMLCIETRKYTWMSNAIIITKVMEKKKRIRLRSSSKVASSRAKGMGIEETSNPTIEEHKKRFPNQSNIFSIIPDIKKKL
tara:strand:+ start:70 stop:474 length:405 start_codon:yes stop_codon:yes gene_type:complete